jgi:hypothetical protein
MAACGHAEDAGRGWGDAVGARRTCVESELVDEVGVGIHRASGRRDDTEGVKHDARDAKRDATLRRAVGRERCGSSTLSADQDLVARPVLGRAVHAVIVDSSTSPASPAVDVPTDFSSTPPAAGSRHRFHRYSLANQLLIANAMPEATRVAEFKTWLKLGYCVRKGEGAIRIWVPIPPTKQRLQEWRHAGAEPAQRPRTHFRLGPVFDRSQVTELPPPAQPMPLDPPVHEIAGDELSWALEALAELAGELGCSVGYEPMPADHGGYYRPSDRPSGWPRARPPTTASTRSSTNMPTSSLCRSWPKSPGGLG